MRVPLSPTSPDHHRRDPGPTSRRARARRVVAVLGAVVVLGSWFATAAAAQGDPTVAPITSVSPDGRTGTDGTRTLALSQAADLDPAGATMSVSGSGYVETKGIYVALCVVPPQNHAPSPCGGGVDTEGTQGAAQWISSNPPSYGVGLAQPYGPGGSFQTSFTVRAEISPGIDCRQVRCAVVTRNDHTRGADRSQDIIIPVTFRAAPAATTPVPAPGPTTVPGQAPDPGVAPTTPATTAPVVTVPPLANPTTTLPAPVATVAADGLSASDGARTLALATTTDLDPEVDTVTVSGQGFDETRGIYVSLCALTPGEAPGPCRTGSTEANRWVSSNPPDYGVGVATPFGAGGTFEVDLAVAAVIDAQTDCRAVTCAILTRADDTAPDDRTLDLAVPVSFAATSTAPGTTAPTAAEPDAGAVSEDEAENASSVVLDDRSTGAGPIIAVVAVATVLATVAAAFVITRRRAAATTAPAPPLDGGPIGPTPGDTDAGGSTATEPRP